MDVVVIGAGLAGLTAARDLVDNGLEVVVLEGRDRVGGRTLNHVFEDGAQVELGGQWVGPTQDRVLALCDQLDVPLVPTHNSGMDLVSIDGVITRFKGDTFGLPPHVLVEALIAQRRLERMARAVPLSTPWTAKRAAVWDAKTFESWLRTNLRFELTRRFFRVVTTAIFAAEAAEISLLHFLFYIHSGGLLDRLLAVENGAQESRIEGGSQVLSIRLAAALGSRVLVDHPVHALMHSDSHVVVSAAGTSFHADHVIVATPPHLAGRIQYDPALPSVRDQLTQSLPMGAVIKCVARYETPFWRKAGLSGIAASLDDPVSLVFDNSPPDASSGMLVAFVEGSHARAISRSSPDQRRELVVASMARLFGAGAAQPIDYVEKDWAQDPFSGGAYGSHAGPGVWSQLGRALREPIGRIHFAGTETSDVWNGYMDGAVRSGERAAREVLALDVRRLRT